MFLYFKIGNKVGEHVPKTMTNRPKAPPFRVLGEQATPRRRRIYISVIGVDECSETPVRYILRGRGRNITLNWTRDRLAHFERHRTQ